MTLAGSTTPTPAATAGPSTRPVALQVGQVVLVRLDLDVYRPGRIIGIAPTAAPDGHKEPVISIRVDSSPFDYHTPAVRENRDGYFAMSGDRANLWVTGAPRGPEIGQWEVL